MSKQDVSSGVDKSPKVFQRSKIKNPLNLKPFEWTIKQEKFIEAALNNKEVKIIFCNSCAGVGKTLLAIYCCLKLLSEKKISSILYLRNPVESASRSIGFLQGNKISKLSPYGEPLFDHLKELLPESEISSLAKDERIIIESIGFCKGRTYHNAGIILDQAEDLSVKELRLIMSRMGRFSKLFIIGDSNQQDIKNSGFVDVCNLFNDQPSKDMGILTFEFTKEDCMRSDILQFIIERFDSLRNN